MVGGNSNCHSLVSSLSELSPAAQSVLFTGRRGCWLRTPPWHTPRPEGFSSRHASVRTQGTSAGLARWGAMKDAS